MQNSRSVTANNADKKVAGKKNADEGGRLPMYLTAENLISAIGWIVLSLMLAYASRHFAGAELNEIGDFAADSLLVQDAKHLQLWIGHYSRIGFNHPGPFILYVLAAGEWLLFDCLHLVKSPLAGQIFAVSAFNAGWLVLIAQLLFRLQRSLPAMLASWISIVLIAAYANHNFLNGLWFPHLFLWPFAVYCLALTRMAAGKTDSLITLALSCGTLLNGHVSFIAICGIMLIGTIIINRWQWRENDKRLSLLSFDYLRSNRNALIVSGIVFSLFLMPLLAETIRHFPGPVGKYIEFGAGNANNSIVAALHFVAQYWGLGLIPLALGISLSCFLAAHNTTVAGENNQIQKTAEMSAIQHAVPVLLMATIAMLFYAIVGADDLSMPYIGLFYFSVPAITMGLVVGFFVLCIGRLAQWFFLLVFTFFSLLFIHRQAAFLPDYMGHYANPDIPAYFNKLTALNGETLVLDLDDHEDWKDVWAVLLGVEVYAARHGHPNLFCINKHWQIAFTEKAKCSPAQVKSAQRFIVSASPEAASIFGESHTALGNIHFYKFKPLQIPNRQMVDVAANKTLFAVGLLQDGWSPVSEDFVWSENKKATLSFDLESERRISSIDLDIAAFLPHANSTQSVSVIVNNTAIGTFHFTQADNRAIRKLTLPLELLRSTAINIELHIESPTSPKQAGISLDPRRLGVALYGIELEDAAQ